MGLVRSVGCVCRGFQTRKLLRGLALGLSFAQIPPGHNAPRTTAARIFIRFMAHSPLRLHVCNQRSVCLLIHFSMECNREELRITAAGGQPEEMLLSARKKNSPEAWAPQHPRSASPAPIAEVSSHRASLTDSAPAPLGLSLSPQGSTRPISRSVYPRTNRLSQALVESR